MDEYQRQQDKDAAVVELGRALQAAKAAEAHLTECQYTVSRAAYAHDVAEQNVLRALKALRELV